MPDAAWPRLAKEALPGDRIGSDAVCGLNWGTAPKPQLTLCQLDQMHFTVTCVQPRPDAVLCLCLYTACDSCEMHTLANDLPDRRVNTADYL